MTELINRHQGELWAFFAAMMSREVVAPATGSQTLRDQYRDLAAVS